MSSHWISLSRCQQSWNLAKSYIILPLIMNKLFFLAQGFIVTTTLQLQQYNVGVRLLIVPNVRYSSSYEFLQLDYVYMHGPMFNIGNTTGILTTQLSDSCIIINKIPNSRNLASCKICCVSIFTPDNCCLPASNIFAIIECTFTPTWRDLESNRFDAQPEGTHVLYLYKQLINWF